MKDLKAVEIVVKPKKIMMKKQNNMLLAHFNATVVKPKAIFISFTGYRSSTNIINA